MLLYAGYKECTVHLLAGMPVCYIYSQQGGRQWSRPMAGRTNMKDKKLEEAVTTTSAARSASAQKSI